MRRTLIIVLVTVTAFLALALIFAGPLVGLVDARFNRVTGPPREVSAAAADLHRRLWIADLHCDALLWDRGLLERSPRGLADVPRLHEGHVALQVFSIPNAYPLFSNYHRTPSWPDILGFAAFARRWPRATWWSPPERVVEEAVILQKAAARSRMPPIARRSFPNLLLLVTDRGWQLSGAKVDSNSTAVRAILAVEGLHVRRGDVDAVDRMYIAGVRVFGLAHMSDNAVAGSAHGWRKYGLTDFGRRVVARIDSLGGIIDLAHASEKTIDDVLAMPNVRVIVSHTGVDGTCPGERNLSDDQLRRIAAHGGIVGIGFWPGATCGDDVDSIVRAMRHAVDVAGIEAVALGSDFDGAVRTPFDAAGLAQLTEGLLDAGFPPPDIARIMGLNALEFFLRSLPPGTGSLSSY